MVAERAQNKLKIYCGAVSGVKGNFKDSEERVKSEQK